MVASTIGKMPDQLVDNPMPTHESAQDPDIAVNAAGGPVSVPEVTINRSTLAEQERRRVHQLQATALLILATGTVLTLVYVAKLLLVVVLLSILFSFVLAPLVDLLTRLNIPRAVGALVSVSLHGLRTCGGELSLLQPCSGVHARGSQI